MANYAALIDVLSIAGSRKSDGTANASGKVWFFQPGGNTPVNVYSDAAASAIVTAPVTLTDGGLVNRSDYPDGLFATQPIRLYIEDSGGTVVSDTVWIPATAGDVGISSAATTATTLGEWITQARTSTGGQDFKYLESAGATERTIKSKFSEIWISVKDFGAKGDGVAIDTVGVQAAVSRVKALGGGVVYFPPGTYKLDQAITMTSAAGVSLVGAGSAASTITSTHASADCFTITGCNSFQARGLTLDHATTSTGTAFNLDTCTSPTFNDVVHQAGAADGWRKALVLTASASCTIINCTLEGESSNAASRGIALGTNSSGLTMIGGRLEGSTGYAFEADGNSGACTFVGTTIAGTWRYAATASGATFTFLGCAVTQFSVAAATIPGIRLIASSPFSSSGSAATGGNITPSLIAGNIITLTASSGGAGTVTVNDPALFPASGAGQIWDFILVNTAGGAITWAFGASYRLNGAVSNNNGQTTMIRFYCDGTTIREASFRAVTTT